MALHRDIYWLGRQWSVTGHGLQAIDQRLKGEFDIEIAGLWDDSFVEKARACPQFNAADFDKAMELARARYPGMPRTPERPAENVGPVNEPPAIQQPTPMPSTPSFTLRVKLASAKFVPQWRVRR
jgi:hypothetical protein